MTRNQTAMRNDATLFRQGQSECLPDLRAGSLEQEIIVEALQRVIDGVSDLHHAGAWPEAHRRCLRALDRVADDVEQNENNNGSWINAWANDIADRLELDPALIRTGAWQTLAGTPLAAIVREIEACRTADGLEFTGRLANAS